MISNHTAAISVLVVLAIVLLALGFWLVMRRYGGKRLGVFRWVGR